jgi:hypothetical protein
MMMMRVGLFLNINHRYKQILLVYFSFCLFTIITTLHTQHTPCTAHISNRSSIVYRDSIPQVSSIRSTNTTKNQVETKQRVDLLFFYAKI